MNADKFRRSPVAINSSTFVSRTLFRVLFIEKAPVRKVFKTDGDLHSEESQKDEKCFKSKSPWKSIGGALCMR